MHKPHFPHRYGWYIRRGYGVHAIRNKREAKALCDFCLKELARESDMTALNATREEIYRNTLAIYKNNFETKPEELHADLLQCGCGRCSGVFAPYDIWKYTNEHANWYWF